MKVPIKPISINKCWQGRRFKTPEYSAWREECMWILKNTGLRFSEPCKIQLTFHCSRNFKIADIDNMIKPALDALVESGIIKDDRLIERLSVDKIKDTEDFWEFDVQKL